MLRNVNIKKLNEKRTETYSLRITPTLKENLDKLSPSERTRLHEAIMIEMARAIHNLDTNFNPSIYIGIDEEES